jgi:hypothetical protein
MKDTSNFDFGIFCEFFKDDDACNTEAGSDSAQINDSCFDSLILSSHLVQKTVGQPPIEVRIWINLENNHEFADEGVFSSLHHVEVYRGHAHHHKVNLRVYFSLTILMQVFFQMPTLSFFSWTMHNFQPLFIFVWLSLATFSPQSNVSLQQNPNESVTVSSYLVMMACSLCIRTVLNFPTIAKMRALFFWGAGLVSSCVLCQLVVSSSSWLLFPVGESYGIFYRMFALLSVNTIIRLDLQRRSEEYMDSHSFVVVVTHFGLVCLLFIVFPVSFQFDDQWILCILIRLVEVCPVVSRDPCKRSNALITHRFSPFITVFWYLITILFKKKHGLGRTASFVLALHLSRFRSCFIRCQHVLNCKRCFRM